MDNQVRELLRDIAEDIPPQREVPPTLRPRARRRIAAIVGVTVVAVAALALGGMVAVRSITESSPRPADLPNNVQLPNAPEAWQRIALPYSDGCPRDNCHGMMVAAGDAGIVATAWKDGRNPLGDLGDKFVVWSSPDGLSWHLIEGDGGRLRLAAAEPGFVAVGWQSVWTSTDGVSWDRAQPSPEHRDLFWGVTAGGPGVVAVGQPNKAWYSSDGLTWEAAEVPPVPADVYPGDDRRTPAVYMSSVAAGADRLVATGSMTFNDNGEGRAIWVSSDGTSWRDVPIDGNVFPRGCDISDVAGTPDGFVAVGECPSGEPLVWRSPDGVRWERVGWRPPFDGETPGSVAAGPGGWVAVGGDAVWTSVDGESWTRVPTGPTFQEAEAMDDVTAWNSRFVVVGTTEDGQRVVWISGPQQ